GKAGNRDQGSGNSCLSRFVLSHPFRKEREMDGARSVFPVGVGFGVDREVHATAGQEASATCSSQRARNGWGTELGQLGKPFPIPYSLLPASLVPECLDGVHVGGFPGGIDAEDEADG